VDDAFSRARGVLKLEPGETVESVMRELRGRAPNDPIDPWEELRDDIEIPKSIREDHARRRAAWLAKQREAETKTTTRNAKKDAQKTSGTTAARVSSSRKRA
jgi:hypothetical protein